MQGICPECDRTIKKLAPCHTKRESSVKPAHLHIPPLQSTPTIGCWVCRKFSNWLLQANLDLYRKWQTDSLSVQYKPWVEAFEGSTEIDARIFMVITIQPTDMDDGFPLEINFIPTKDCSFRTDLSPRNPALKSLDVRLIKTWVETCWKNHQSCVKSGHHQYPTRLIDIGTCGDIPKLILPSKMELRDPYITLSHRWGSQNYTKLTLESMTQLQKGINLSELPQVFRDAIEFARSLGFRLIWIDSLCIIQGEQPALDWKNEARKMDQTYGWAFLNISATLSADGTESLFEQDLSRMSIPFKTNLIIDGISNEYYLLDGAMWTDEIVEAPLNKRGWVLQERFLAQRVLHFGPSQLGWECNELQALESFPDGLPCASGISVLSKGDVGLSDAINEEECDLMALADVWTNLISVYSQCSLTYSSDKSIALGGLTNRFSMTYGVRFTAGMFADTDIFIQHLLWERDEDDRDAFPAELTTGRAPSWSWLSVDGQVDLNPRHKKPLAHLSDSIQIPKEYDGSSGIPGTATGLSLSCLCLPLQLDWQGGFVTAFSVSGYDFAVDPLSVLTYLSLDYRIHSNQEWNRTGELSLVPLLVTNQYISSIVVRKLQRAGQYMRVGVANISFLCYSESESRDDSVSRERQFVKDENVSDFLEEISAPKLYVSITIC